MFVTRKDTHTLMMIYCFLNRVNNSLYSATRDTSRDRGVPSSSLPTSFTRNIFLVKIGQRDLNSHRVVRHIGGKVFFSINKSTH